MPCKLICAATLIEEQSRFFLLGNTDKSKELELHF